MNQLLRRARWRGFRQDPLRVLHERRLYRRIGLVAQTHASLDMSLRNVWRYYLPEEKRYRVERPQFTTTLTKDVRRWLTDAELPPAVHDAALTVLARVDATADLRNRVVHDYWQPWNPLDPDIPGPDGQSMKRERWRRLDVRAPLGTIRATPSGLADADRCLAALRARIADVNDLLMLLWHHTDIIVGGRPATRATDLLARIAQRGAAMGG